MNHPQLILLCAVTLLFQVACDPPASSAAKSSGSATSQASRHPFTEVGNASWYGGASVSHQTASGYKLDDQKLTAAHRSLPLGSSVRVTNLENDKSVDVTITDRGPYVHGRIIDLSRAAAEKIGLVGPGVEKVRLTAIPN